jgi:cytochrome o ubiquinol oxidase operon protein cyoD
MAGTHAVPHDAHHASHGTRKSYVRGFVLSLVLTLIAFAVVMAGSERHGLVLGVITILAVAQLVVQLVYFLHLGAAPEQRNNTVIFVLTALLIANVIGLSLWVMHNANVNMMPTQMTPQAAMTRE